MKSIELLKSPHDKDHFFAYDGNNIPHHALLRLADSLPASTRVLDIGAGYGRASMPFALRGMHVDAVDEVGHEFDLLSSFSEDDIHYHPIYSSFPNFAEKLEPHDLVIINDLLFHASSDDVVIDILDAAYDNLAPGGLLWANYMTVDSVAHQLEAPVAQGKPLPRVFQHECGCSGVVRTENVLFVPPLLVPAWASHRGAEFVESKLTSGTMDGYYSTRDDDSVYFEYEDKCYVLLQKPY